MFGKIMTETVSSGPDLSLSEAWTQMSAEEVFRENCSDLEWLKLVQILLVQSHLFNPVTCVQPFSVRNKERTGLNNSL